MRRAEIAPAGAGHPLQNGVRGGAVESQAGEGVRPGAFHGYLLQKMVGIEPGADPLPGSR
jgi:hypothetical protein